MYINVGVPAQLKVVSKQMQCQGIQITNMNNTSDNVAIFPLVRRIYYRVPWLPLTELPLLVRG